MYAVDINENYLQAACKVVSGQFRIAARSERVPPSISRRFAQSSALLAKASKGSVDAMNECLKTEMEGLGNFIRDPKQDQAHTLIAQAMLSRAVDVLKNPFVYLETTHDFLKIKRAEVRKEVAAMGNPRHMEKKRAPYLMVKK
jgi:hypothetical protein